MADKRDTSGRRLPLPAPEIDETGQRVRVSPSRLPVPRTPMELPRLPEAGMYEESNEIDLDEVGITPPPAAAPGVPAPRPRALSERLPLPPARKPTPPAGAGRTERPTAPGIRGPRTPPPRSSPPAPRGERRPLTQDREALIGGRYKIVERIGQGGMGKVYKVTHAQLGKVFALKIISEGMAETDEARQLFYREARMASSLSHPNITSVVDFGEDDRVGVFMVMELVDGEPLVKVLHREKQLAVHRAVDIAHQIAEALDYIHNNDIVHCDIKTENILLSETNVGKRRSLLVKLLDFGLARTLSSRHSQTLSGTPHYVAPERIRGEPASAASDVYSLGILLYEMLTGKVPWDGPVQHILSGHLEEPPKPPSQLRADGLDPALERLILRALAKRPMERHKDMAAFLYELRTVMDMIGLGRGRRSGKATRIVVEKSGGGRDELARLTLDACRLPTALLSASGRILLANPAFAKFVMGVAVEIEGLAVKSTPLAGAWASLDTDLARTLAGQPVRRLIEIDVKGGEVRRLLLWLDAVDKDRVVVGVHPVDL